MNPSRITLLTLALASSALAQNSTANTPKSNDAVLPSDFTQPCGADLLIDDFAQQRTFAAPNGETKRLNALGGDWGQYGGNYTISTTARTLSIVPARGAQVYPADPKVAPGSEPTFNWFYTQFSDQRAPGAFDKACANLTPFTAFEFDALAPRGFDFNITFTMRAVGDCKTRIYDSVYHPFSKYYTTPGTKQTIRLPFSDFVKNWAGEDVNWAWNKDMTWVNLVNASPRDALVISNVWLKGATCGAANGTTTTPTSGAPGGASRSGGAADPTATTPVTQGSGAGVAAGVGKAVVGVAAVVAAAAML
ncbi:hypothetical protein HK097_000942 [Rhizophlyctis rosea]|uniref:Uncharacterized protein n=1 Tax=Rhizophlyctis rosea TaxID=64517 RepID=A0AAD5S7Q2_9FUNG|nr:hypothetical protein HK097_000942 [Rhizophlyctis rosea]